MSAIQMIRRFDIVTYKNKNGTTDTAQVPTAATVTICRQGATSKTTHTFLFVATTPYTIDVDDVGDIVAGDVVQVAVDATHFLTVDSVPSRTQLSLVNDSASVNVTVTAGDRLTPTTNLPTIYSDPLGTTSVGNPLTANSATGRVQAYVRNKRFDYLVSGTITPARSFANAEGGYIPETYINALDFLTLQAAIDALPSAGGTVYVPEGTYTSTSIPSLARPLTLPADRPVRLLGAGVDSTTLRPPSSAADILYVRASHQTVEHMTLDGGDMGSSTGYANGRGVVIGQSGTVLAGVRLIDCNIIATPGWGIYVRGGLDDDNDLSILSVFSRVFVGFNRAHGAIFVDFNNTTQFFDNCYINPFVGYGMLFQGNGATVLDCAFENGDGSQPYIAVDGTSLKLQHCWFEDHLTTAPSHYFIETNIGGSPRAHNLQISGCIWNRTAVNVGKLVRLRPGSRSVVIEGWDASLKDSGTASSEPHMTIDAMSGSGTETFAVIMGGVVRDATKYIPFQLSDAQPWTIVINQDGLRLPRNAYNSSDSVNIGRMYYDRASDGIRYIDRSGNAKLLQGT